METETLLKPRYFSVASDFIQTLGEIKTLRATETLDLIMSTLDIDSIEGKMHMSLPNGDRAIAEPTDWAAGQIANKLDIPKSYFDRMRNPEHLQLFDHNVNYWMHKSPKKVLIRRFGGKMIAMLSDRYRAFDSFDVANVIMSTLMAEGFKDVKTSHMMLTDKLMSFSVYDPRPEMMISMPDDPTDRYMLGLKVKNSDVGYSSFEVSPMLVRLVCTNGMVSFDPYRKIHRGQALGDGDIWSKETLIKQGELSAFEIRDITRMAFNKEKAIEYVDNLRKLKDIHVDPTNQDIYMPIFNLSQGESEQVWSRIEANNAYEYVQAATSYANDLIKAGSERGVEIQEQTTDVLVQFRAIEKLRARKFPEAQFDEKEEVE